MFRGVFAAFSDAWQWIRGLRLPCTWAGSNRSRVRSRSDTLTGPALGLKASLLGQMFLLLQQMMVACLKNASIVFVFPSKLKLADLNEIQLWIDLLGSSHSVQFEIGFQTIQETIINKNIQHMF